MKTNDTPQDAGKQNRRGFLKTGAASIADGLSAGVIAASRLERWSQWKTVGDSSPELIRRYLKGVLWSSSYFAASRGGAPSTS